MRKDNTYIYTLKINITPAHFRKRDKRDDKTDNASNIIKNGATFFKYAFVKENAITYRSLFLIKIP